MNSITFIALVGGGWLILAVVFFIMAKKKKRPVIGMPGDKLLDKNRKRIEEEELHLWRPGGRTSFANIQKNTMICRLYAGRLEVELKVPFIESVTYVFEKINISDIEEVRGVGFNKKDGVKIAYTNGDLWLWLGQEERRNMFEWWIDR